MSCRSNINFKDVKVEEVMMMIMKNWKLNWKNVWNVFSFPFCAFFVLSSLFSSSFSYVHSRRSHCLMNVFVYVF
eukprot:03862.XXX_19400_19621_1 [CDS] Oithona nana genome sequencing.